MLSLLVVPLLESVPLQSTLAHSSLSLSTQMSKKDHRTSVSLVPCGDWEPFSDQLLEVPSQTPALAGVGHFTSIFQSAVSSFLSSSSSFPTLMLKRVSHTGNASSKSTGSALSSSLE